MRLLANENVPGAAVDALRLAGHDVAWVRIDAPGSPDDAVLARGRAETRVLLTFDKDFGELVFRRGLGASVGVILIRGVAPPDAIARLIVAVIGSRDDWEGNFSVVEAGRVRMRGLR